jgi:hypothetical protein
VLSRSHNKANFSRVTTTIPVGGLQVGVPKILVRGAGRVWLGCYERTVYIVGQSFARRVKIRVTQMKTSLTARTSSALQRDGKRRGNGARKLVSLRKLTAFGIWADRDDVNDAVQFTRKLRSRMEHGHGGD